jgi:hypothetical protein
VIAATPLAVPALARTVRPVTAAGVEELTVPEVEEEEPRELPPLVLTGDDETDEALALLRAATLGIHEAQDTVSELSEERKRLVLELRRRTPPVLFRLIADAAGSTDQTIYKIHREALREEQDRVDARAADGLGYPDLASYRAARDESTASGEPETPAYTPPPELHVVDEQTADTQPEGKP